MPLFDHLFPIPELGPVDFETLRLTPKPNQFLVLPEGLGVESPHLASPRYAWSAEELGRRWKSIIERQPRVSLLAEDPARLQSEYVQRTRLLRFPDLITVRFLPEGEGASKIAIYSRSVYGRRDFGVNRNRIESWLRLL